MRTSLGPTQSVPIRRCPYFRGCFKQDTFRSARRVHITVDVRISRVSLAIRYTLVSLKLVWHLKMVAFVIKVGDI